MTTATVLLQKLLTIERAIGTADNATLRELVNEAEECLLQMQKERAESLMKDAWRGVKPQIQSLNELQQGRWAVSDSKTTQ
ncbi:MAG: hypothetical protein WCF30_04120 [Terracidiphilus sp.]